MVKKYKLKIAEEKKTNEKVLKTDMNTNNNKINNCSKQISMLTKTKTKLMITE